MALVRTSRAFNDPHDCFPGMKEKHEHVYTEISLFRIVRVHKNYQGTAGDKAILYRKCTCGKGKAFEYGAYKDMQALLKKL